MCTWAHKQFPVRGKAEQNAESKSEAVLKGWKTSGKWNVHKPSCWLKISSGRLRGNIQDQRSSYTQRSSGLIINGKWNVRSAPPCVFVMWWGSSISTPSCHCASLYKHMILNGIKVAWSQSILYSVTWQIFTLSACQPVCVGCQVYKFSVMQSSNKLQPMSWTQPWVQCTQKASTVTSS